MKFYPKPVHIKALLIGYLKNNKKDWDNKKGLKKYKNLKY